MGDKTINLRDLGPGPDMTPVVGRRQIEVPVATMQRARLPAHVKDWTVDGIQDTSTREHISKFIKKLPDLMGDGVGLILSGDTGRGKTAIAALVGLAALGWQFSVLMVTHAVLQEMQFQDSVDSEGRTLKDRIREVDVLIIDGINDNFVMDNKFGPTHTEELISKRNWNKRSTILTTRLSVETLQQSKELASLFSVMQGAMVGLRVKGDDLRVQQSKALKRRLLED